jgi:branched-subunit amino acid transport protein
MYEKGVLCKPFFCRWKAIALGASSRSPLSPASVNALRSVPPVVLSIIMVPKVLIMDGTLHISTMNAYDE